MHMRRLIQPRCALLLGLLLVLLTAGRSAAQDATPGIIITEILAANNRTVADDRGRYSDWIELHNPTDTPISLGGYTLTDDPDEPDKWRLPFTTLAPGAFLVVWASGDNRVTSAGWHTSFQLSRGGEYVGVFGPDGQVVDAVTFGAQETDVSLGRLGTVSDRWVAFPIPTPWTANTTRPQAAADALPVLLRPGSGRFAAPVTVRLETPVGGATVYYTLDGADPTLGGQEYTAPLEIAETTVLRAVALRDGAPVSAVTTATYLVGESTGLPVVSLVTEPAHLWDTTTGIYVNAEARGREWERPMTVEWLSPEGQLGFSVGAGLRIHGNVSRRTSKQSFRLYFRGEYGPRELAYPLFGASPGQSYNRLVLRAGANDSWSCHEGPSCSFVRDQVVRELHGAMGQVAARGRWIEVYLNGAYWGLYNLTERIDETFLDTHFDHDYWDFHVHTGEHGAWDAFVDWVTSADLNAAVQYEQAIQQLDIENFTSLMILQLWAGNTDWDWYAARMRYSPDTRWRLFVWDAETTLYLDGLSSNEFVINSGGSLSRILASLLASPQYQAYFTAEVERHLAGALATEAVRSQLATLVEQLRPAIAAEAARWLPDREPAVMVAQWEAAMQRISDSLESSERRLRQLSDLETFRQLLPQLSVSDTPVPAPIPPPLLPAPLPPGTRIALLMHHPDELSEGDAAIVTRLTRRGASVNVISTHDESTLDPALVPAAIIDPVLVASSYDLLLMSSSIRVLETAARYAQTATPLIFWEPLLLAAGVPLSPWGGRRSEQTDIRIVDADHPITAGLSTDQPLRVVRRPDTFSVAYPPSGPGVHVLARHLTGDDAALMVVEAGAELANGQLARARTVFWFGHHDTFHLSTGEAVRLFDRAVDWALGLPRDAGA